MATFIATDAEKAAASYLDWDDDAVGKFAKNCALTLRDLKDDADGLHKVTTASCAMMLIGAAVDCNADEITLTLEGHTHSGVETGDWTVTVKKIA